jgi:hypothetical protein
MAWGYVIGAIAGGVMANNARKEEKRRKNHVAATTGQGIADLQPLYKNYRDDAAREAGLSFTSQGLQVSQAHGSYLQDMSGYGRTGLVSFDNPGLDPTAQLSSLGLQGEASLLQRSQALEQRLGTLDSAERQLRGQALGEGVTLGTTEELMDKYGNKDNIK